METQLYWMGTEEKFFSGDFMEKLRHQTGNEREWNESYYFNFYDPQENIGGFTRIGFKPNKKEGVGYLFLFYKDDILAFQNREEIFRVPEEIRVGSLEFEPGWTVTFSGTMVGLRGNPKNVFLTFKFSEITQEFSYLECVDRSQVKIAKVVAEDHYEQMGVIEGEITVGSEIHTISGLGERDHSWGERDWNAPDVWIYVTAHFNTEFGINIAKMVIKNQEIDAGFIMKNGKNVPVERISVNTISEENVQKRFEYTIWDCNKTHYILRGEVLKRVQIPYKRKDRISILNENLSQFTCENKKGFGIAEYLVRIQ